MDLLTDPYLDELRQSAPSDRLCAGAGRVGSLLN